MPTAADDLRRRTWELLQPGDIELHGVIVETEFGSDADIEMHRATVAVGEAIAEAAGHDPADTYVYSGTTDTEFASNQHQGLTLAEDDFVWECQQLLRDGSFDLVFYFEADAGLDPVVDAIRAAGYDAVGVRGDADPDSFGDD